jgi:hypothetical protein
MSLNLGFMLSLKNGFDSVVIDRLVVVLVDDVSSLMDGIQEMLYQNQKQQEIN